MNICAIYVGKLQKNSWVAYGQKAQGGVGLPNLAIKGTRFQTKTILAFDQNYWATKMCDNFHWGINVDDLSAQYFNAAIALWPMSSLSKRINSMDGRKSANHQPVTNECCFRWNFSPNGCPNPQSCRYKHVCIHGSQQHKWKSCPSAMGSSTQKQWPLLTHSVEDCAKAPLEVLSFVNSSLVEDCPLIFHAWENELLNDLDRSFILDGLSLSQNLTPCVLTAMLMITILVPCVLSLSLKWISFS